MPIRGVPRSSTKEVIMITWKCHICGEERPDHLIGVHVTDVSSRYGLREGTMKMNVRYCIDNPECVKKAPDFDLLGGDKRGG